MGYPHWLIVAGAVLVALGFIGFAFHKNKNPDTAEDNPKKTSSSPIPQCRPSGPCETRRKPMAEVVTALCVLFSISIFLVHAVDAFRAR
jgi:hypothetical protein